MADKLQGKSAVVTGGGRGIGRGIALALAREGANVVVNDIFRDADGASAADKVVDEISKAKGTAVANYDSVASMAGGENIIRSATDNFGRIDILVNVAGNYISMPALEMTEEAWDSTRAVHLKGHFACSKAAAVEMAKQKSGRIINFSSRGSFYGSMGSLAYGTAKAGILGFTAMLAKTLKEFNITANCILPSADTQLFPGPRGNLGDNMPLPQIVNPDMVAPVVVYLATDAAKDITGQFIYASGGDICIYTEPFQMTTGHRFLRKPDEWTVDELSEIIPRTLGLV
jgi:NAD(P)-dependent dehydrogenase (short-subunit alcohol dehydrogenase family)